jgi:hypothetical protein
VTVPHGLRASAHQREVARRALLDEAVAAADGRRYLEPLRGVADPWEFDLVADLLSVRLAASPERIPERRAKQVALARDRTRRRSAGTAADGPSAPPGAS